ncbi:MAG TPA: hypothetical protein VGN49_06485 [Micrococcaceae bacterium]|jgi:hypothetical protein|nr:hypothetical protein [Micrococcaceae bacterium]
MSGESKEQDPLVPGGEPGTGQSVPSGDKGVGLGAGTEPTTFEPEEDPEAAEDTTAAEDPEAELGHS